MDRTLARARASSLVATEDPGVTAVDDRRSYGKEKRHALDAWRRRLMLLVSELRAIEDQE